MEKEEKILKIVSEFEYMRRRLDVCSKHIENPDIKEGFDVISNSINNIMDILEK